MTKYIYVLFLFICSNVYAFEPPVEGDNFGVHFGKYNAAIQSNEDAILLNTAKRTYPQLDEDKLATIEAGATEDQTGAEIKVAYESEADTNAYTDAEKTKLAGIEVGANVYNPSSAGDVVATSLSVNGVDGLNGLTNVSDNTSKGAVGDLAIIPINGVWNKVEGGIASPIGSGGGVAIDDNAGDGATTVTWSANKSFDELALKINTSAIDDVATSGADKLWSIDQVKAYINQTLGFPLVSILAPASSQWITESPYTGFNGTSSDTGSISAMEWKLESGGTYAATTGTTAWSVASVPVAEGENTLYARATDDQANQTEKTVTFNVDSIAPVVVAGADSAHDGVTPFTGGLTLTDVNPDAVTFSLVNGTPTSGVLSGTYPNYVTPSITPDGTSDVTITYGATDLAGNSATGTDLLQVFLYQAPTLTKLEWYFDSLTLNKPTILATAASGASIVGGKGVADGTTNSRFTVPVTVSELDFTAPGSIELDFSVGDAGINNQYIFKSTGVSAFWATTNGGRLVVEYDGVVKAGIGADCDAAPLLQNTDYNILIEWDGSNLTATLDGTCVKTATITPISVNPTSVDIAGALNQISTVSIDNLVIK